MGLNCCKENQSEEPNTVELQCLLSQNEVSEQEHVPELQGDQNNDRFTEGVLTTAMEQLTEHDIKLSVPCEEDPEGLGGIVVIGHKSFPLSF